MSDKQPKAIQLADKLEYQVIYGSYNWDYVEPLMLKAAKELRRLHIQRDELLDFITSYLENYHSEDGMFDSKYYAKRAAELIAKVKTK